MTITQIIQTLTNPVVVLLATAVLAIVVSPWLRSHQAQIDAATASIQSDWLRGLAQDAVRWLESDPAMAQLPGLVQRANGITWLTQRTGLPASIVSAELDAAFNALSATGGVVMAPKPAPTAAPVAPSLADLAAAVLAQIAQNAPPSHPVGQTDSPPPSVQPGAAVGQRVPILNAADVFAQPSPLLAPSGAPLTAGPTFPEPLPPPGPENPAFA